MRHRSGCHCQDSSQDKGSSHPLPSPVFSSPSGQSPSLYSSPKVPFRSFPSRRSKPSTSHAARSLARWVGRPWLPPRSDLRYGRPPRARDAGLLFFPRALSLRLARSRSVQVAAAASVPVGSDSLAKGAALKVRGVLTPELGPLRLGSLVAWSVLLSLQNIIRLDGFLLLLLYF